MTVSPGTYNITLYQGATFTRQLIWKDENDALVDLTSYTARMQIRKKIDGDLLETLTTENGGITLGGAAGTIDLLISATATALIDNNGIYDLELITGSTVTRLVKGSVTLDREVTV